MRAIREGRWRGAEQLHDLVLDATGDKGQAEEAMRKYLSEELRAGRRPEL